MGSFYGASSASNPAGAPFSSGPFPGSTQPPGAGSAPPLVLPQFGSFGPGFGGLQFGNLGGAFGQSPFVPTGRQPDWSTGPIASSPVPSTQGGQGFPASQPGSSGDAILPGPPGLAFRGKGPPGPPPGLQGSTRGDQGQGQQRLGSGSAGSGGSHGQQQGLGGLSGAPAQHVSVADSKGDAAAAALPDDVFDAPPGQVCGLLGYNKGWQCMPAPSACLLQWRHPALFSRVVITQRDVTCRATILGSQGTCPRTSSAGQTGVVGGVGVAVAVTGAVASAAEASVKVGMTVCTITLQLGDLTGGRPPSALLHSSVSEPFSMCMWWRSEDSSRMYRALGVLLRPVLEEFSLQLSRSCCRQCKH